MPIGILSRDDDHDLTLALITEIRYSGCFLFIYFFHLLILMP